MRRLAIFMATTVLAVPVNGAAQETSAFLYDPHGRMTAATRAPTGEASHFSSYIYDNADNRTQRVLAPLLVRAAQNELRVWENMVPGDELRSLDGRFRFVFQTGDGNLVLYFGGTPLWASNTGHGQSMVLGMQGDGNLILFNPSVSPIWTSGTGGHPGARLVMQNDGNLVIYDGGTAIWATGTGGH